MFDIIDSEVFARYPGFRRAVVLAYGADNSVEVPEVAALLRESEAMARRPELEDFKNHPLLNIWAQAFSSMGLNPNRYPPSVTNLIKRCRSGKELPYVNTLVALFNCISLRHMLPCGGDDLGVVQGDLRLGPATGKESYVPLGKPEEMENPPAGEIIYYDTGNLDVFCRAWCWKNGDRSKLRPDSTRALINIDTMSPGAEPDSQALLLVARELAGWLEKYTGARTSCHILGPDNPRLLVEETL